MIVCYLMDEKSRSTSETVKNRVRVEELEVNIKFNESEDWL